MSKENIMAHSIPPITTLANGLELSDPIPCEIAAGKWEWKDSISWPKWA